MEHKNSKTQGRSNCQVSYSYGQNTPEIPSFRHWIVFHQEKQQQLT